MEIFISIFIWVLALYGLFEIIRNIICFCTFSKNSMNGINIIITVKNQENNIEYFLRSILFKMIYGREDLKRIIVVDMNSSDNTRKIIENLEKEYNQIELLDIKELQEIINGNTDNSFNIVE